MTDPQNIDLDAYFRRIKYKGSRAPTLRTLQALHFAHATAIPFENLDVLAGKRILLDPASLAHKLVDEERGGYCFELNGLFSSVLIALGFKITNLVARVRWKAAAGATTARTHRIMRVDLPEGPYLADAAFSALALTAPLKMEPDLEQATPHETFRLLKMAGELELQANLRAGWVSIYRFTQEPQQQIDYEMANWYTATNPNSIFLQNLIVTRPTTDCRLALLNTGLTFRYRDGRVEEQILDSIDEISKVLRRHFGISVSDADLAIWLSPHFSHWQAAASGAA